MAVTPVVPQNNNVSAEVVPYDANFDDGSIRFRSVKCVVWGRNDTRIAKYNCYKHEGLNLNAKIHVCKLSNRGNQHNHQQEIKIF